MAPNRHSQLFWRCVVVLFGIAASSQAGLRNGRLLAAVPGDIHYTIETQTGNIAYATTNARIYITVFGAGNRSTGSLRLAHEGDFSRGRRDVFDVVGPDVGPIDHIFIRGDGSGRQPGWYVNYVRVTRAGAGAIYFLINRWVTEAGLTRYPLGNEALDVRLREAIYVDPGNAAEVARDGDEDGLKDNVELDLANALRPFMKFDRDESARRRARPREPVTLFQVRPRGCSGLDCASKEIWIRWVFLFRADGGYGPAAFPLCDDAHDGDNDTATYRLRSSDRGVSWVLESITLGMGEDTFVRSHNDPYRLEWYENVAAGARFGRYHPVIYFSASKHHMYFDQDYDEQDSHYSDYGCNDNVDGGGDSFLPDLSLPVAVRLRPDGNVGSTSVPRAGNNVGEPNKLLFNYLGHLWGYNDTNQGSRLGLNVLAAVDFFGGAPQNRDKWLGADCPFERR